MAAVFGQVGAGEDADRCADQDGYGGENQTAEDGIEKAAARTGRRRHLREYSQGQSAEALPEQRSEDQDQPAEAENRCGERQPGRKSVFAAAGGIANSKCLIW